MSEIGMRIKSITDLGLSPLLKSAGFRKSGTQYSREDGGALQVINVQSSQWNNASSGKFTLNVGIHFSSVAKMLHGSDPMPAAPKECFCLMRRRVGELLPEGTDRWWAVGPETDVEAISNELTAACRDYVFPWLAKVRTIAGAATEMEQSRHWEFWQAAGARLVLGEHGKASELIKKLIESYGTDRDAAHPTNADLKAKRIQDLRHWAADHNLPGFIT
jgi:hypothetical protein